MIELFYAVQGVFIVQCTLVQSAVLQSHVVRPSVTLVDCEILKTNCKEN